MPELGLPQLVVIKEHRAIVNGRMKVVEEPRVGFRSLGTLIKTMEAEGIRRTLDAALRDE